MFCRYGISDGILEGSFEVSLGEHFLRVAACAEARCRKSEKWHQKGMSDAKTKCRIYSNDGLR
jgi:hypothetical protein